MQTDRPVSRVNSENSNPWSPAALSRKRMIAKTAERSEKIWDHAYVAVRINSYIIPSLQRRWGTVEWAYFLSVPSVVLWVILLGWGAI